MSKKPGMSRAVRTARGAFGALAATLLAAASHGIAGGTATPLAVAATAVLALPLCVLLAGRIGSLWRLALAVGAAQFVYHWSFAGLGAVSARGSAAAATGLTVSPHEAHLSALTVFAPFAPSASALAEAGAADSLMWLSHAAAAALTIALMHRGELAAMQFLRVLRSAVPVLVPTSVRLPQHPAILVSRAQPAPPATQVHLGTISYRGPPTPSFCPA